MEVTAVQLLTSEEFTADLQEGTWQDNEAPGFE